MALLSWVEKDGKLLYLTDREYRSRAWKRLMVGLKDADPLGHGTIHGFYDFAGGRSFTVRQFWKSGSLPLELEKLVKDADSFDKHFKHLFKLSRNSDLVQMIILGPTWLGKKAVSELSKRKNIEPDLLTYLYKNTPLMYWPSVTTLVEKGVL